VKSNHNVINKKVENALNVKFDDGGRFTYDGVDFFFMIDDWDNKRPIRYFIGARGYAFVKLENEDLDLLLETFVNKWPKTKAKIQARDNKEAADFKADTLIHQLIKSCSYKNDLRFDGQNLTIRTGKNPKLVEWILNNLNQWQDSQ
jgi:hypothetical protein